MMIFTFPIFQLCKYKYGSKVNGKANENLHQAYVVFRLFHISKGKELEKQEALQCSYLSWIEFNILIIIYFGTRDRNVQRYKLTIV